MTSVVAVAVAVVMTVTAGVLAWLIADYRITVADLGQQLAWADRTNARLRGQRDSALEVAARRAEQWRCPPSICPMDQTQEVGR